ncbi:hypothetical protein D3C78_830390 [compost metagenome]
MLCIKPFPFQPVAAEDANGLVHFSNFVTSPFVWYLYTVVLPGKAHDDIAHSDKGRGNPSAEDKVQYGQKHQCGQGKHHLGDRSVEITSAFGLVDCRLRACRNGLSHLCNGIQQTRMQLIVLVAEQDLLRITLAPGAIRSDGPSLHRIQPVSALSYILKQSFFLRRGTERGEFIQGFLEVVFLIFVDIELCQMLLVASHNVKTCLFGALVRDDHQFLGKIV